MKKIERWIKKERLQKNRKVDLKRKNLKRKTKNPQKEM